LNLLQTLWLVPALPLAAFLAILLGGRLLPRRAIAVLGTAPAAAAAALAVAIAWSFIASPPSGGAFVSPHWTWIDVGDPASPAGHFLAQAGLYLDPLAVVMMLVVTVIGFLILLYSTQYMAGDESYGRFFAYMNLFVSMMLVLVLADNLLFLYLGWEGVGLCSYLLIGFWYREQKNVNAAMKALDMDAIYLAFDVDPSRLMKVLPSMADMGFSGVNLTVPLKQVAFKGLRNLDKSARLLGAVNTVEFRTGGLKGYNTDGIGFQLAIKEAFGVVIADRSVFVLGAGGAGRAVAITCATNGASSVALTDMDARRAALTAKEIHGITRSCMVKVIPANQQAWRRACGEADIVVQATPIGMKQTDKSLLPQSAFRRGQLVFDLVYMYPETVFTKAAKVSNGLGMLLHQGAASFEIWTGKRPPLDVMRKALEKAVYHA